MDKDLFEKKLSEVADWALPKLSVTDIKAAQRSRKRPGRPPAEEQYQEEHEQEFLALFNGVNPTMAPEIKKIKIQEQTCSDCGKFCEKGRKTEIKFHKAAPGHIAHRRTRCVTCGYYQNPETGQFDIKQGPACQWFLNWAKREFSARNKVVKTETDK